MWIQLTCKLSAWLISEVMLGWLGCDNLADYGESMLLTSESYVLAAEHETNLQQGTLHRPIHSA